MVPRNSMTFYQLFSTKVCTAKINLLNVEVLMFSTHIFKPLVFIFVFNYLSALNCCDYIMYEDAM